MSLLTTNQLVFSVDNRLSVNFDETQHNWGLVIQSAQERDSASYLCQVNIWFLDQDLDPFIFGH